MMQELQEQEEKGVGQWIWVVEFPIWWMARVLDTSWESKV